MNNANVKLSNTELQLVTDAAVILTKNNIILKTYNLFGLLAEDMQQYTAAKKDKLPPEVLAISPKIYKGEQYRGLPYVMLDYPRHYKGADVFAIRCLFWWGNFFSITLHLGGRFVKQYEAGLRQWVREHGDKDWFISVGTDAWQHHFEEDNYQLLPADGGTVLDETLAGSKEFIKLAKKIPLQQWDDAMEFFTEEYNALLRLVEY